MKVEANGTLQTTFRWWIPFLFATSSSRITNGKLVDLADQEKQTGAVYSIHITPFLSFGFVIPNFLQKRK